MALSLLEELEREQKAAELNAISFDIYNCYLWILCAFGIPGNVFTIVTILNMGKMSAATFFVALLGACDGFALATKFVFHLLYKYEVRMGDVGCKSQFIPAFLTTMANWTLVLIALERFFSVCYPLKKLYLFTKKRSYTITAIIFMTLLVIFAGVFGVLYESTKSGMKCGTKHKYYGGFTTIWYWINACLFLFLPFLLNIGLTICIIRGLFVSRKDRRSLLRKGSNSGGPGGAGAGAGAAHDNNRKLIKESERAEKMITIMLILASILFLVLATPACVYFLTFEKSSDSLVKARWKLFEQIQFVLLDSTHAINFFLYFISAKRFRAEFISILTCRRWPRSQRRGPTSSSSGATDTTKLSSTGNKQSVPPEEEIAV